MKNYTCKKIHEDIIIDGDTGKPQWQAAEAVTLVDTVTGSAPRQSTMVKLLWSEQFLYVSFSCKDTYINATLTEYNDLLYNEEVVEVFIDDNNDLKTYIEIEVNPLNAVLHYSIHNDLKGSTLPFARVGQTVKSAVYHNEKEGSWDVEIAIPFTEFITAVNIPPSAGDKWHLNLYRIDRPEDGNDEYLAWSPTGKANFHTPSSFGELIFDK